VARNQFYVLDLDVTEIEQRGLVGRVRSWDWAYGTGWIPAQSDSNLPSSFGFGMRIDPFVLANRIAQALSENPTLPWSQFLAKFDEVEYLLPQDFVLLERELETKKIRILKGLQGPETISVTI